MQASTSRAGPALVARYLAGRASQLPACTCRLPSPLTSVSSTRASSSTTASSQTSDVTVAIPRRHTGPRSSGRSQAERLADRETRKTLLVEDLSPWATPNDVRKLFADRLGHADGVEEVVFLPTMDLRPTGNALVEFHTARTAQRAWTAVRGKTSESIAPGLIDCRIVDPSRKPFPAFLSHRIPLSSHISVYQSAKFARGYNLKLGMLFSGRAVLLSGFPVTIHPLMLLERLAKEDFYPVRGPGTGEDNDLMDEIVKLRGAKMVRDEKFANYLVRLPNMAEAHRLVGSWNATYPKWGGMMGSARINADIVW